MSASELLPPEKPVVVFVIPPLVAYDHPARLAAMEVFLQHAFPQLRFRIPDANELPGNQSAVGILEDEGRPVSEEERSRISTAILDAMSDYIKQNAQLH